MSDSRSNVGKYANVEGVDDLNTTFSRRLDMREDVTDLCYLPSTDHLFDLVNFRTFDGSSLHRLHCQLSLQITVRTVDLHCIAGSNNGID